MIRNTSRPSSWVLVWYMLRPEHWHTYLVGITEPNQSLLSFGCQTTGFSHSASPNKCSKDAVDHPWSFVDGHHCTYPSVTVPMDVTVAVTMGMTIHGWHTCQPQKPNFRDRTLGKTTPITPPLSLKLHPLNLKGNRSNSLPKGWSARKYTHALLYKNGMTSHYYVTLNVTVMIVCGDYTSCCTA